MNNPQKHHFVPECYLKGFADSKGQLWRKNLKYDTVKSCAPAGICYKDHLYTILGGDKTVTGIGSRDAYYIEKNIFGKQEAAYPRHRDKVISFSMVPRIVPSQTYISFLDFLITLKRRNPYHLDRQSELLKSVIDVNMQKFKLQPVLAKICNAIGIDLEGDAYFKTYDHENLKKPDFLRNAGLRRFVDKEQRLLKDLRDFLLKYRQTILYAPLGKTFVTSDNPGFTINHNELHSFGGFVEGFQFVFPVSSKACLMIESRTAKESCDIDQTIYNKIICDRDVKSINNATRQTAINYIISESRAELKLL